jgi:hypothetical protein
MRESIVVGGTCVLDLACLDPTKRKLRGGGGFLALHHLMQCSTRLLGCMARGSVDVLDVADMLNAASKEGCGGMDLLCFHFSIFETLIVARELYVKNNFIYDFFYDFNMIKFMIWFFSIFSL